MAKLVKNHGGNLVRITEAIDGFKSKYGFWPTEIHLAAEAIRTIEHHHLTAEGFRRLNAFVCLVPISDEAIVAKGPKDQVFDYGREGWDGERPSISVGILLGLE